MKCDICGEVNDAVEIHMCKQCANKFSDNVNCIKRDVAIYKRAFELARLDGLEMDGYIVEAKKELEEEDVKNS